MSAERPRNNAVEEESVSVIYEFAGSKFTYKREGDKEVISTLGPIKDRIIVKVSCKAVRDPVSVSKFSGTKFS